MIRTPLFLVWFNTICPLLIYKGKIYLQWYHNCRNLSYLYYKIICYTYWADVQKVGHMGVLSKQFSFYNIICTSSRNRLKREPFSFILVIDTIKLFWYLIHVELTVRNGNSISMNVIEDKWLERRSF
jgi:hypothetical protein